MTEPKLTRAQEDAMLVMREHGRVGAWKRNSSMTPGRIPRVNTRAAHSLVRLGLARCIMGRFDAYATTDKFELTPDGYERAHRLGPAVLSAQP